MFGFELLTCCNNGNRSTFGKAHVVSEPCECQYGNAEVQRSYLKPHAKPLLPAEKHNRSDDGRRNADDAEPEEECVGLQVTELNKSQGGAESPA